MTCLLRDIFVCEGITNLRKAKYTCTNLINATQDMICILHQHQVTRLSRERGKAAPRSVCKLTQFGKHLILYKEFFHLFYEDIPLIKGLITIYSLEYTIIYD